MTLNFVKSIFTFNQKANLLQQGYVDTREAAYPIEEMLEGFDMTPLGNLFDCQYDPKHVSRAIIAACMEGDEEIKLSDVDRLDKHVDAIVFNFGSIFKLGLTPQQAVRAIEIVMQANAQKLNSGVDTEGKQLKPTDFVGPEEALQKLLDSRG